MLLWRDRLCESFFFLGIAVPLSALSVAFFLEYVLGYKPCQFCLYERWVYASILVCSCVWTAAKNLPKRYGALAVTFLVLAGLVVTGVHIGIERGWISEELCAVSEISYEELLESLQDLDDGDERMPSCANVPLRIVGVSLAECNFIFLIMCFFVCFYVLLRMCRDKKVLGR